MTTPDNSSSLKSPSLVENTTLRVADWFSEYTPHHHHHANSSASPLKIVFSKKSTTGSSFSPKSPSSGFVVVTSNKKTPSFASTSSTSAFTSSASSFSGRGGHGRKTMHGPSSSNMSWKEINKHLSHGDPKYNQQPAFLLQPSSSWNFIAEIDLAPLVKLLPSSMYATTTTAASSILGRRSEDEILGETIEEKGNIRSFDKSYAKITAKASKPLQPVDMSLLSSFREEENTAGSASKLHGLSTTSADNTLVSLIDGDYGHVFATDAILAFLMASPRAGYPWDIIARVDERGRILFDTRNPMVLMSHLYSNGESGGTAQQESVDEQKAHFEESFALNEAFRDQVLKKESYVFPGGSPDEGEIASDNTPAIRYRRFPLGQNLIVVCRCHIDGVMKYQEGEATLTLRALNDALGTGHYSKPDTQRGTIFSHDMKINSAKLTRWAIQAMLAGTDFIKIGFLSRLSGKGRWDIVGISQWRPEEFATNIANVTLVGALAVLKAIVEQLRGLPAGSYILHKEYSTKSIVRVYELPLMQA